MVGGAHPTRGIAVLKLFSFRSRQAANLREQLKNLSGDDEEVHYRPIEWPLIKRLLVLIYPFRRQKDCLYRSGAG